MNIIISEEQTNRLIESITEQVEFGKLINRVKGAFDFTQCSTSDTGSAKNWQNLYNMLSEGKLIKSGEPMLILWGPSQTMYYTMNGKTLSKEMKVSTGAYGFTNAEDSASTSTGLMKISNKIKAPKKYQVLVGKKPINLVLGPDMPGKRKDPETGEIHDADVLTGLLELVGLEPCNKNVYSRSIYIHGTNKEKQLGGKHSNGCIRVSNENILFLLNTIRIGTKLYVRP
jgi:hypothetical protein